MKITIELHDTKYSVETKDDIKFEDFMEVINSLSKIIWSADLVNDYWE